MLNLSTNLKDDELYIVMDLMDTDMHRVIQSSQPLSDAHAKYFLHQLLRGVKYLHDNGVLHRDLKPGNLLLSKTCQLKIADFGLALSSNARVSDRPPMTEHVVTRWYRAPELMLQPDGLYDQSVDMWSVGCIFAEILGRKALFPGKNFLHQLTLIFDVIGAPPPEATTRIQSSQAQRFLRSLDRKSKVPFRTLFPNASEAAVDLLDRLLEFDPAKRISAQDALAHPYMQDIERKYRNRSGGIDPPPLMRVDFSFDSKNLSNMDLRALIVKEVDNHRKSIVTRSSTSPATTGEKRDEPHQVVDKGVSGVFASDVISSSAPTNMSTSSGTRISKIHATLRQAQVQDQEQQENGSTHQLREQTAIIGSNRQRVRVNSKPPVPKQQAPTLSASNQQEHVRVVAGQASLLSESLASCISPEEGSKPTIKARDHTMLSASLEQTALVGSIAQAQSSLLSHIAADTPNPATASKRIFEARAGPSAISDSSASNSIAAAIALGQRSKALIAALAKPAKTLESAHVFTHTKSGSSSVHHPQAWLAKRNQNPESSSSSSSPSSSSPPRSNSDIEEHNVCPGVPRTARPGSAMFLAKSNKIKAAERDSVALGRPRRTSSAGPTRSKSRPLTATRSLTARSTAAKGTYVGSINSLIQAQRSNTGQSLAESANSMLATMDRSQRQESADSREEGTFSPSSKGNLKAQRSTAQLPGADLTGRRHPTKKLTVPKSPKFSVMSWQKKR
ncbi:hypothetical protein BBO99_00000371 [Phytophthora kernoviae]|uniref:Protein kinase domain-containing protein n=1 Tax=Phytophthora kernoviae TaxID=325452 RepID=A0A3R7HNZ0_9STRA|nr:hypothetical protein JM16_000421 [Phytophthora kernoviae]RLN85602.1 hypothetical protein BBO99_00000371 [Phytophthora kernoviae]